MVEYIEREAFLEHMKRTSRYFAVKFDVEEFPAADVAPVRHGYWILQGNNIGLKVYECSECKDDDYWKKHYCFGDESFCPNCGARMDGDCHEK